VNAAAAAQLIPYQGLPELLAGPAPVHLLPPALQVVLARGWSLLRAAYGNDYEPGRVGLLIQKPSGALHASFVSRADARRHLARYPHAHHTRAIVEQASASIPVVMVIALAGLGAFLILDENEGFR
jgi:hypothetical protein